MQWVFDQFNLAAKSRILEVGCGPGLLWLQNVARIPEGWDITLSDFSPGMLDEAANRRPGRPALVEDIAGVDDQINIAVPDDIVDHGAIGVLDIE